MRIVRKDDPSRVRLITKVHQIRGRVTFVEVEAWVPDGHVLNAYTGRGSAVCDQIDRPNPTVGYELALGRALKDVGRKLVREGWREVGHGH